MPRWRAGRVGCLAAGHSPLLSLSIAGGRLGSEKAGRDSEKAGRERQASRPVVADPSRESESRAPSSGSESLIRVADPSHIRVSDLSRTSESHLSRTSESHIRAAHPSYTSESRIRVIQGTGSRPRASRGASPGCRRSGAGCYSPVCVCVCVGPRATARIGHGGRAATTRAVASRTGRLG